MRRFLVQTGWQAVAAGLTLILCAIGGQAKADSNFLWNTVNGKCVPHERAQQLPGPCSEVSLAGGYAVYQANEGAYQYLLIPTRRVTGIEDPYLQTAAAPNYFADAWSARKWSEMKLGVTVPRQDISLAVNSLYGRTQNQLHIHIDCLRPDVAAALAEKAGLIGNGWTPITLPPARHIYLVTQIISPDLAGINPFALIAAQQPGQDMASETAVVIAAEFSGGKQGFYLLSSRANLSEGDRGNGEELQDTSCAIVKKQ